MISALIGDMIGSRFEFFPIYSRDFELLTRDCDFTDDSVCTTAVADGILNKVSPAESLRSWCLAFPQRGYGGHFHMWIHQPEMLAYGSFGNGAVMRISPVALLAKNMMEAERLAEEWTAVTHDHPDAVLAARTFVRMLYRLRMGEGKEVLLEELNAIGKTPLSVEEYHTISGYHIHAMDTLLRAVASVLEADDFESAMRNVIYIGSDTDTTAAVAGPMAEFLYGIPEALVESALKMIPARSANIISHLQKEYLAGGIAPSWMPVVRRFQPLDMTLKYGNDILGKKSFSGNHAFAGITYVSQGVLQLLKPHPEVALISIRNDEDSQVLTEGWGMLLTQDFYDLDDDAMPGWKRKLADIKASGAIMEFITKQLSGSWPWRPIFWMDADKIAAFVLEARARGMKEILVSCDYGRSRSVGVATAIFEALGADEFTQPQRSFNERCRRMVSEALNTRLEKA